MCRDEVLFRRHAKRLVAGSQGMPAGPEPDDRVSLAVVRIVEGPDPVLRLADLRGPEEDGTRFLSPGAVFELGGDVLEDLIQRHRTARGRVRVEPRERYAETAHVVE